jgi:5'-3' exonuclease
MNNSVINLDTYIFIDGSYFCFYRYYSLINWWKNAYPEDPLGNPILNPVFVDKFKKTFVEHVAQIPKKLGLPINQPVKILVGKDCKREEIWRTQLFPNYKANRPHDDSFLGGPFFKMAYDDSLFIQGGAHQILYNNHLEADDCIAIMVKHVLPDKQIFIITSDKDYLQLSKPNISIYNLAYKKLTEQKSSAGNPECDLFCKIVMGDPSDNIKSVLKKCGPKTALKCFENRAYFEERMKTENAYNLYKLNETLVDFNKIPEELVKEFLHSLKPLVHFTHP